MTKRMLIDASHREETRVVVVNDHQLEDFDFETSTKHQLKGNIYLAKVTRVEPSLQAAFVDYGGNRHGFLAFSEIHPDYFQIPQADREALQESVNSEPEEEDAAGENGVDGDDEIDAVEQAKRRRLLRSYKIQEVIKRRQILLVQVVKEERGSKGAALTTYLSLAGRYCVLMPNTGRGGGISRKISNPDDRKRLKGIVQSLDVPLGMGLIVRTAGAERTKLEIRRDYDYLLRLWSDIRDLTLKSIAPCLIYEEADLIKRSIRDLYTRDIEEVLVEGEDGYRTAKKFMGMLMPSRARHVKLYKEETPLFLTHKIEEQLDAMYMPEVRLRSGGSIVINPTEALISIDVNSGKSTRERHIEETAYRTNLEAAEEIARQMRLRDLAGLIVIDFIDMGDGRSQRNVERKLRDATRNDRARLQLGKISSFGLLELSRQRLRPSFQELSSRICPHCAGTGYVRSVESAALQAMRRIELEGVTGQVSNLRIACCADVAIYLLNQKRDMLITLEQRYGMSVRVDIDAALIPGQLEIERTATRQEDAEDTAAAETRAAEVAEETDAESAEQDDGDRGKRRRRRRRRRGDDDAQAPMAAAEGTLAADDDLDDADAEGAEEPDDIAASADEGDESDRPRRRRRRRSGRGRRRRSGEVDDAPGASDEGTDGVDDASADDQTPPAAQPDADQPLADDAPMPIAAEAAHDQPRDTDADSEPPAADDLPPFVVPEPVMGTAEPAGLTAFGEVAAADRASADEMQAGDVDPIVIAEQELVPGSSVEPSEPEPAAVATDDEPADAEPAVVAFAPEAAEMRAPQAEPEVAAELEPEVAAKAEPEPQVAMESAPAPEPQPEPEPEPIEAGVQMIALGPDGTHQQQLTELVEDDGQAADQPAKPRPSAPMRQIDSPARVQVTTRAPVVVDLASHAQAPGEPAAFRSWSPYSAERPVSSTAEVAEPVAGAPVTEGFQPGQGLAERQPAEALVRAEPARELAAPWDASEGTAPDDQTPSAGEPAEPVEHADEPGTRVTTLEDSGAGPDDHDRGGWWSRWVR